MTIKEFVESDITINLDLLKEYDITIEKLNNERYVCNQEYIDRFLSILLLLEQNNTYNYLLNCYILYAYLIKEDYEMASTYIEKMFKAKTNRNDVLTFKMLLNRIMNKTTDEDDFEKVENILVSQNDTRFNNIHDQNEVRKVIYLENYRLAKAKYSLLYKNKPLRIEEVIIDTFLKIIIDKENKVIIDAIKSLDFDFLDKYRKEKCKCKDIFILQGSLIRLLHDVIVGAILPEPKELPKKYNIYDAFAALNISELARITTNPIVKALSEKILEQNQINIENSYTGEVGITLDKLIEWVYELALKQDFKILDIDTNSYLYKINRSEFAPFYSLLIENIKNRLKNAEGDEYDQLLAELTETLVDLSRPHSKKGLYNLKLKLSEYLGINRKIDEDTYNFDLEYNYNLPNIYKYISQVKNGTLKLDDIIAETNNVEDFTFTLVVLIRECYKEGKIKLGNEIFTYLKTNFSARIREDEELSRFINAVMSNKESLQYLSTTTLSEQIKKLI